MSVLSSDLAASAAQVQSLTQQAAQTAAQLSATTVESSVLQQDIVNLANSGAISIPPMLTAQASAVARSQDMLASQMAGLVPEVQGAIASQVALASRAINEGIMQTPLSPIAEEAMARITAAEAVVSTELNSAIQSLVEATAPQVPGSDALSPTEQANLEGAPSGSTSNDPTAVEPAADAGGAASTPATGDSAQQNVDATGGVGSQTPPPGQNTPGPGDAPAAVGVAGNVGSTESTPEFIVKPNVLHDYATYTYNLSLHGMSHAQYDAFMADPMNATMNNVLIASGGKFGQDFVRNQHFKEDFFFEKMEFESIIGLTGESRNANNLMVNFTLIEPYGVTLFNRLIGLAKDVKNDTAMAYPYLIQIDFYGQKTPDSPPEKIPKQTKWMPVTIINIVMKISHKGAEYEVTAAPFNHVALNDVIATVPVDLEPKASSLTQFFEPISLTEYLASEKQAEQRAPQGGNNSPDTRPASNTSSNAPVSRGTEGSYKYAINKWYDEQVKEGNRTVADEIQFVFHDDILKKGKFVKRALVDTANRKMDKHTESQKTVDTRVDDTANPKLQVSVKSTSSIVDVISMMMKASEYVYEQILEVVNNSVTLAQLDEWKKKPLKWFKIIPRVKVIDYDGDANVNARKVTYIVVPYIVHNSLNNEMPMGGPRGQCKEYDYIFTGKNKDIIDFELKFDSLFFNTVQKGKHYQAQATGAPTTPTENPDIKKENRDANKSEIKNATEEKMALPAMRAPKYVVARPTGSKANKDPGSETANGFERNLMMDLSSDLMMLEGMKIVGDPDFIKQDDLVFPPTGDITKLTTPNNSIVTDLSQIFVKLTFKTPSDYDANGIADPGTGKYNIGCYSGLYQVIRVVNTFANGKFTQTMDANRLANQSTPGIPGNVPTSGGGESGRALPGPGNGADPSGVRTENTDGGSSTTSSEPSESPSSLTFAEPLADEAGDLEGAIKQQERMDMAASMADFGDDTDPLPGSYGNPVDVDSTNGLGGYDEFGDIEGAIKQQERMDMAASMADFGDDTDPVSINDPLPDGTNPVSELSEIPPTPGRTATPTEISVAQETLYNTSVSNVSSQVDALRNQATALTTERRSAADSLAASERYYANDPANDNLTSAQMQEKYPAYAAEVNNYLKLNEEVAVTYGKMQEAVQTLPNPPAGLGTSIAYEETPDGLIPLIKPTP